MKKIYLIIIAGLLAIFGTATPSAVAQNPVSAPTVCSDGNSDCYLVVERNETTVGAWNSFMVEIDQENYDYTVAILMGAGVDTVRLCSTLGKITVNLWDVMGDPTAIELVITDSLGTLHLSQIGFETAPLASVELLETYACVDVDCAEPTNLKFDNITDTSVEVSFESGASSWQYAFDTVDLFTDSDWVAVSAKTFTIGGLTPGSDYFFRLRTDCGDESYSAQVKGQFATKCSKVEIPLVVDFEDFFVNKWSDINECWHRTGNSNNQLYPQTYGNAHSGTVGAFWFQTGDVYVPTLITPPLDANLKDLAVNLYYYCYNADDGGVIEVGAVGDPSDPSTYTLVDTIHYDATDYAWKQGSLDLSSYTGSDNQLFIRVRHRVSDGTNVTLDDITIEERPDCGYLTGDFGVIGKSDDAITVLVRNDHANHDGYNVYCSTSDELDKSLAIKGSSDSSIICVTGLSPNTEYYVWIEGDCGGDKVTEAVALGKHSTTCEPVTVTRDTPYTTDLENAADTVCMWKINGNMVTWRHSSVVDYPFSGMKAQSGSECYFLSGQPGEAMLTLPTFDFSGMDTIAELSFSHFCSVSPFYKVDHLSVLYRDANDKDWVKIVEMEPAPGEYFRQYVKLPKSQGAAFYQVAILGTAFDDAEGVSIDDIRVGAANRCAPPTFTLDDITERAVTVKWSESALDKHRIQIRRTNDWSWTSYSVEGEDGSGSTLVSPLLKSNSYTVRMQSVCDDGTYGDPSPSQTFTTLFCDNFDTYLNYPPSAKDTTIEDALIAIDSRGPSSTSTMDWAGCHSYSEVLIDKSMLAGLGDIDAIAFVADSVNLGTLLDDILVFMAHTTATELTDFLYDDSFKKVYHGPATFSTTGDVRIGLDAPFHWDGSSNIVIGFYNSGSSCIKSDALYFGGHASDTNRFVYARSVNGIPIDNLSFLDEKYKHMENAAVPDIKLLSCKSECYPPVVESVATTSSTITVRWYNEKDLDVELSVRPTGSTAWENSVTVKSTDGLKFTFTMLPAMTQYDIRLRRDCSGIGLGYSDEVIVHATTDTACSVPTDVKLNNITATTATITWSNTTVASRWEVHVWNDDFNQLYDVNTCPATIDGLIPGASYKVRVRAFCGDDGQMVGDWSETTTIQLLCAPVTGLNAVTNGNEVVLEWKAADNYTDYLVSWGENQSDPNEQIGYALVSGTTYTVKGLKAKTYTFRVRTVCEEGWNSVWSEVNASVLGVDNAEGRNARFMLQPNPATDRVTLCLDAFEGTAKVSILSVDGRQVSQFNTTTGITELNLGDMAAGTYFVHVQTEDWISVRKLIVK